MWPSSLTTRCGKDVRIEGVLIADTYREVIAGRSRELAERIVERAGRMYPWGAQFPTHLIRPDIVEHARHPRKWFLPNWSVHAQLASSWTADPQRSGSHLTIAFFTNDAMEVPLSDVVKTALLQVDWASCAEDFDY